MYMYTYLSRLNIDMARIAMIKPYMCVCPAHYIVIRPTYTKWGQGKGLQDEGYSRNLSVFGTVFYQLTKLGRVCISESGTVVSSV
jgi:hypothetical protein